MTTPKAEFSKAAHAARLLCPSHKLVTLMGIEPKRDKEHKNGTAVQTFAHVEVTAMEQFIRAQQERSWNAYVMVNEAGARITKKATKADVTHAHSVHVDIDCDTPDDGKWSPEWIASEVERIRALITATPLRSRDKRTELPPPSAVVFTGGGFAAYWHLREPLPLDDDTRDLIERHNKALILLLGGDHSCWNIDRVMRLPFTINFPDFKKIAKGRGEELATLISPDSARMYSLDDLPAPVSPPREQPTASAPAALQLGTVQKIAIGTLNLPGRLSEIAIHGHEQDSPKPKDNSRSAWLFDFVCNMKRLGHANEVIAAIITDPDYKISESVLGCGTDVQRYVRHQLESADKVIACEPPTLHANTPLVSAREFVKRRRPTLMHYNEDYLAFDGAAYSELEEAQVGKELYDFLHGAQQLNKDGQPMPFNPNKSKVTNITHALVHETHRERDRYAPPCWLNGDGPRPSEIVACRNGLLHLPTGELLPPTERFFTRNALAFDYAPDAPAPSAWLRFLEELWPNDSECIETLQEMVGYLLIPDTSQQKMFLLVGPPRGGKGTIAHVVQSLVGRGNCCAPSLNNLSDAFGLEPLIGKQLAVISDLRMSRMTDHAAVTENLLRISGEDTVSVNRKYKGAWHGRLPTRFLMLSNDMPRFADASGALGNRFVPLLLQQSFLGRENHGLLGDLLAELPSVLMWAIDGWRRLHTRGHFELPRSSREAIEELVDLASPEAAFIKDDCELLTGATVSKAGLFTAWQQWCASHGHVSPGSLLTFSSRLQSACVGRVKTTKPRIAGRRVPSFAGIRLARGPEQDGLPWEKRS